MFKLSTINSLSLAAGTLCLTSLASINNSIAADLGVDAQMQATNLLQPEIVWNAGTSGFQLLGRGSEKYYSPQEQAQHILLSVNDAPVDVAGYIGSGQPMTSRFREPQLQAASILSRNIICSPVLC